MAACAWLPPKRMSNKCELEKVVLPRKFVDVDAARLLLILDVIILEHPQVRVPRLATREFPEMHHPGG